jgi:hypothetical protein
MGGSVMADRLVASVFAGIILAFVFILVTL